MNERELPQTGYVAQLFELSEGQLNGILRRRPEIKPPVARGRKRWRPEDIEALAEYLGREPESSVA